MAKADNNDNNAISLVNALDPLYFSLILDILSKYYKNRNHKSFFKLFKSKDRES